MSRVGEDMIRQALKNTNAASVIVCDARRKASNLGITILKGSHTYLYAALLADFVQAAKRADWIGPAVQMDNLTVKPTDQFLMDHLFGVVFAPIFKSGGTKFLTAVRTKAEALIAAKAEPVSPAEGVGNG